MDFLFTPNLQPEDITSLAQLGFSVCPPIPLRGRWEVEYDAPISSCLKHTYNHLYCNTYPLPLPLAAWDMGKPPGYLDLLALIFTSSPEGWEILHLTKLSNTWWFFTPAPTSGPLELISLEGNCRLMYF